MRQRLAAVLAADIVGYTRLMGADQKRTLVALTAFRAEVFGPNVASHGGTIIKSMGDGWLVEFSSVSDAVACALAVQEALARQDVFRLRIGINIGDILHEQDDIFGDGVNIAARLQEIAPIGGIALSGAAHSSLDGTLAPAFADAGQHTLKHVARPVQVWMRQPDPDVGGAEAVPFTALDPGHTLTRLAIVPHSRASDDKGFGDLADAISGDLLRLLSSSDWITPRISAALPGGDYALTTELRVRGPQMRLEAALTNNLSETVWQAAYDGHGVDTFAWQDEVSLKTAANVVGAVADSERERLFEQPEAALTARECLDCAVLEFFEISDDALTSALSFVEKALTRDPDLTQAYVLAVRCLMAGIAAGYRRSVGPWMMHLDAWLDRAEQADGRNPRLMLCRAMRTFFQTRDPAPLQHALADAFAQAPFDTDVLCLGGWCWVWLGQPARAIDCFRRFERLGRFNSLSMATRGGLATALVMAERDAAAIEQAEAIMRSTRAFTVPLRAFAAAAAHVGRIDDARAAVVEAMHVVPGDTIAALRDRTGFVDTPATERFFAGLVMAGYPEG